MSNDKRKPKAERLARMDGVTTYRDPRDGFSSTSRGTIDITDQDVIAAVAFARRKIKGLPDLTDVGPECIETYYGSTQQHRRKLVTARMQYLDPKGKDAHWHASRRLAVTIGAQMLAGVPILYSQWCEFAYIAHWRLADFQREAKDAETWFMGEMQRALPDMLRVLRYMRQRNAAEVLERQTEAKERNDRERALKKVA